MIGGKLIAVCFSIGVVSAFALIKKIKSNSIEMLDEYTFEEAVNYFKTASKPEGATSASMIKENKTDCIHLTLVFLDDNGNVLDAHRVNTKRLDSVLEDQFNGKDVIVFT